MGTVVLQDCGPFGSLDLQNQLFPFIFCGNVSLDVQQKLSAQTYFELQLPSVHASFVPLFTTLSDLHEFQHQSDC